MNTDATPFLSFLVPAADGPDESLDETLLSLASQTVTDFEVIVLGGDAESLRRRLDEHPPTLRERARVVVAEGTYTDLLNAGLEAARGSHVAVSDHVTWLGHWIETARDAAATHPGRCIRGLVLEQEVGTADLGGALGIRAERAPVRAGAEHFSLHEHVAAPLASTYGVAIPLAVVAAHGLRLDATLGTSAVRRLLLAAISLADLTETGEVVAIHQRHDLAQSESDADLARLVEAMDAERWVCPSGSATSAARVASALRESTPPVEFSAAQHLVKLKDDHISNLDAVIEQRGARIARLEEQLTKRTAQVERLRKKVRAAAPAEDQPTKKGWLRR